MENIPETQSDLERKRDEVSSLLISKEAECADLPVKRAALEVAIGVLRDSDTQIPTQKDCHN